MRLAQRPADAGLPLPGPQRGHLVGGLSPHFDGQLATQLRLHLQLVFPPSGYLAIQLQVVDQLQIARLGPIDIALSAVDNRHERRRGGRPQREDDGKLQQLDALGEHQRGAGRNGQDEQHRQKEPTRPATAAPRPSAAAQIGHGATLPAEITRRVEATRRF